MTYRFSVGTLPVLLALTTVVLFAESGAAQDLHSSRRPSPVGISKTFVGDTYVKVTYGRPYVRGRDVFGDPTDGGALVPFGELWRTGAKVALSYTLFCTHFTV